MKVMVAGKERKARLRGAPARARPELPCPPDNPPWPCRPNWIRPRGRKHRTDEMTRPP